MGLRSALRIIAGAGLHGLAEHIELHPLPAFVAAGKQHGEAHDSDDSGKARHRVSPIVLGRDYRSLARGTMAVPGRSRSCVNRARRRQRAAEDSGNCPGICPDNKKAPKGIICNYLKYLGKFWSEWQDLNLRPPRPERGALPDCATLRSTGGRLIASVAPQRNRAKHLLCGFLQSLAGDLSRRMRPPVRSACRWLHRAATHTRTQQRVGASPSGKAAVFGTAIPRFESWRPSHHPKILILNDFK